MNTDIAQFPLVMRALELIADGRTVRRACDEVKIGLASFQRIIRDVPEFQELYTEAEQRGYDNLAEILLEITTNETYGRGGHAEMTLMSSNIKWFLSRKRPQQYGDKVVVEHNITADKAIVEALERGKQRALANRVIEGTFVEVLPEIVNAVVDDDDWQQFV